MRIRRQDFIYICGNASKHNPARLTGVSRRVADVLSENGHEIGMFEASLAIDDFYGRFHRDILVYHGTWLGEMLNNLRWGIQDYLQAEFNRSYTPDSSETPKYSYQYPDAVTHAFARSCYWDLMNKVRSGPYLKRFVGSRNLKQRY